MTVKINLEKAAEIFGYGEIRVIADNIINRIEDIENEEDLNGALYQSLDDSLIYYSDQWEVIAAYSSPTSPVSISEACIEFFDDMMRIIELE